MYFFFFFFALSFHPFYSIKNQGKLSFLVLLHIPRQKDIFSMSKTQCVNLQFFAICNFWVLRIFSKVINRNFRVWCGVFRSFKFLSIYSIINLNCNSENKTPIHLFYSCNQTKSLWSKLQELMNSEIPLPQNTPQSAFFGFPDNKENVEIINHLHLIFKYYLLKVRDTTKISLEVLKKNVIKTYSIEKQICFNDSKKETKF